MTSGQHSFLCLNKQQSKSAVQEMFGMRVKERQITFDNCSVANMLQRLFPTWHASTLPPFFPGFNLIWCDTASEFPQKFQPSLETR